AGGNIAADGSGGAVVVWSDQRVGGANPQDVYAQRVNAAGLPQWTANGVPVCTQPSYQIPMSIAQDGFGGFLMSWYDNRSGTNRDIYAQRFNASGSALWTADGALVCNAATDQDANYILADGVGGAYVLWR